MALIASYGAALYFAYTRSGWGGASDFNAFNVKIMSVYVLTMVLLFLVRKFLTRVRLLFVSVFTLIAWATLLSILGQNPSFQIASISLCSLLGYGAITQKMFLPDQEMSWASWPILGNLIIVLLLHVFSSLKILSLTSVFLIVILGLLFFGFGVWTLIKKSDKQRSSEEVSPAFLAGAYILAFPFFIYIMAANSPDVLFDSVAFKAAVPRIWHSNDSIALFPQHTQSGTNGSAQYVLLIGNYFGSAATGSFLQLFSLLFIVAILLRLLNGAEANNALILPLSLFICTPAMLWQTSGAYDDLWLSLMVASGVYVTVLSKNLQLLNSNRGLIACGIVLASLVIAKFSLVFFALGIALVLMLKIRRFSAIDRIRKLLIIAVSALLCLSIPLGWRWLTYGNPVWPLYNSVFKASSLPVANEKYNMPFNEFTFLDVFSQPFLTFFNVGPWVEASAVGSYSFMLLLIYIAIYVGLRSKNQEDRHIALILLLALIAWWIEFRYLRYLYPIATISLFVLTKRYYLTKAAKSISSTTFLITSTLAISLIPVGNPATPGRIAFNVIFGLESAKDYLDKNVPNLKVINYLNDFAPPNSTILAPNIEIYQRLMLRKDLDILYGWEVPNRVIKRIDFIAVYSDKEDSLGYDFRYDYCIIKHFDDVGIFLKGKCGGKN